MICESNFFDPWDFFEICRDCFDDFAWPVKADIYYSSGEVKKIDIYPLTCRDILRNESEILYIVPDELW